MITNTDRGMGALGTSCGLCGRDTTSAMSENNEERSADVARVWGKSRLDSACLLTESRSHRCCKQLSQV
jgi:hypothetical protein